MNCPSPRVLLRYVDRGLPPEHAQPTEEHLELCTACAGSVEQLRRLTQAVVRQSPAYGNPQRATGVDTLIASRAQAAARASQEQAWRASGFSWLAVGVLAASVALVFFPRSVTQEPSVVSQDGFHVRGGNRGEERWVGLRVFRVEPSTEEAVRVRDVVSRDDALAFSYTNLRPSDAAWLTVVARDAAGRVHWYHPGGSGGSAIAIQRGVERQTIPERIKMPLATGRLVLAGVFSPVPLSREVIQRWLMRVDADRGPALVGARTHVIELEVEGSVRP